MGVFWLNAAETWIDISTEDAKKVFIVILLLHTTKEFDLIFLATTFQLIKKHKSMTLYFSIEMYFSIKTTDFLVRYVLCFVYNFSLLNMITKFQIKGIIKAEVCVICR